jgi:hypothetical protein
MGYVLDAQQGVGRGISTLAPTPMSGNVTYLPLGARALIGYDDGASARKTFRSVSPSTTADPMPMFPISIMVCGGGAVSPALRRMQDGCTGAAALWTPDLP